jgi:hypothetical protein
LGKIIVRSRDGEPLPRTPTGKLQKFRLVERYRSGKSSSDFQLCLPQRGAREKDLSDDGCARE